MISFHLPEIAIIINWRNQE